MGSVERSNWSYLETPCVAQSSLFLLLDSPGRWFSHQQSLDEMVRLALWNLKFSRFSSDFFPFRYRFFFFCLFV